MLFTLHILIFATLTAQTFPAARRSTRNLDLPALPPHHGAHFAHNQSPCLDGTVLGSVVNCRHAGADSTRQLAHAYCRHVTAFSISG
jgi:hypothetical protein